MSHLLGEESLDFENRFFDSNGKPTRYSWHILRSNDGSKLYLFGREIESQKIYEEALKSEKEGCLWLLDNMPLPMWKNGVDGGCEYLNRAWYEFTGTKPEEQLGLGWINALHPDDADACYEAYADTISKRLDWAYEYRLRYKDGSYRYVFERGTPFYSKNGEFLGYVGALYDIQDRKDAEDEILKKEELLVVQSRFAAMGEMISMIAHQWRQPITVVGMSANNMSLDIELGEYDEGRFLSHLKNINEQVQYLSKTIDDFRNFFKKDIVKECLNITELVQKSVKMVSKMYENNSIELSIEDNSKKATVVGHFGELLQAMLSILNNAKDVMIERAIKSPRVDIKVECTQKGEVCIEISDNGGGIDEGIITKVFDPYFTTKSEKSGTGLGLYMAKIIIEKHHLGLIGVENRGDGAVFRIVLNKNCNEPES